MREKRWWCNKILCKRFVREMEQGARDNQSLCVPPCQNTTTPTAILAIDTHIHKRPKGFPRKERETNLQEQDFTVLTNPSTNPRVQAQRSTFNISVAKR